MATLNQILHEIKEGDNSFHITDDYRVDDMLIIEMINDVRATLIRDEKIRTGFISGNYYQNECCYEIVCEEDSCSYNGVEVKTGQKIYKVKLKPLIESLGGLEIKFVGNPALDVNFQMMSLDQWLSSGGRLFTADGAAATIMGNELWLKNLPTPGMKFICLTSLLKNPTTACDWDNDEEYPVPSKSKLIDMVNYRLMSKGRMPADKLNNATDDLVPPKTTDQAVAAMQGLAADPERERAMQQQQQQRQ
jgi:hypothetical protein